MFEHWIQDHMQVFPVHLTRQSWLKVICSRYFLVYSEEESSRLFLKASGWKYVYESLQTELRKALLQARTITNIEDLLNKAVACAFTG